MAAVDTVNVLGDEYEFDTQDPPGYRAGALRVSKLLGAKELAVKSFVLAPGETVCPYHYEYAEEWLLVLEGTIVLLTPAGEQEVGRGEMACFAAGPEGAHKTSNRGAEPARLLMFSSAREPAIAVYPDSDKIGAWPGNEDDDVLLFRRDGNAEYYDGEV
jgi:uncharacterized cupin superfamily protein